MSVPAFKQELYSAVPNGFLLKIKGPQTESAVDYFPKLSKKPLLAGGGGGGGHSSMVWLSCAAPPPRGMVAVGLGGTVRLK